MKITSFDKQNQKIKRDENQGNLFDLFQKNIVSEGNVPLKIYIVPREFEMRLDRISNYLYGSTDYVEELMTINDIINPYSIKSGQYLYFCEVGNMGALYTKDLLSSDNDKSRKDLIKSSDKKTQYSDKGLPPTIKPSNLEQIKVSLDNRVDIINSFE